MQATPPSHANSKSKHAARRGSQQGPQKKAPTHQPRQAQANEHPARHADPPLGRGGRRGGPRCSGRPCGSGRRCCSRLLGGSGAAPGSWAASWVSPWLPAVRGATCGLLVPSGVCPLPGVGSFFLPFVVLLRGRIVASIPPCHLAGASGAGSVPVGCRSLGGPASVGCPLWPAFPRGLGPAAGPARKSAGTRVQFPAVEDRKSRKNPVISVIP